MVVYEVNASEEDKEEFWDCQPELNQKSIMVFFLWNGILPPLPENFTIARLSSINSDHSHQNVIVALAIHNDAEDVVKSLMRDVFEVLNEEVVYDTFTLVEQEKAKVIFLVILLIIRLLKKKKILFILVCPLNGMAGF